MSRTLRDREALLAELRHRVRNNLQFIVGLVHLMAPQRRAGHPADRSADLVGRLQALALVYDTVSSSPNLAAVDLQEYLEQLGAALLVAGWSAGRPVEVRVEARGIVIDLDTAIRCGLVANELVSNALRHGFAGRPGGRVDVSVHLRADDALVLRVADDGIGLPEGTSFDSGETLGLRIVGGLAEQCGGAARRVPGTASAIEVIFALPR